MYSAEKDKKLQQKLEYLENCPVCGSEAYEQYEECIDYSVSQEKFILIKCNSCSFVFTNPRPDEKGIEKYYQSPDYISHSDTNKGIVNKLYHMVRQKTLADKLNIINTIHKKGSLLDIGCGTGAFLEKCEKDGWTVYGTEPDKGARSVAKNKIKGRVAEDLLKDFENKHFDVITMWHVLEHVHQLNRATEKIKNLLPDTGKLVIAVPNINSYDAAYYGKYWAAYDPPRHLYHFSKKTLQLLMNKHGIKLEEVIPMKFDAFYISLLSTKNKYKKINLVEGFITGLKSNNWASTNENNFSSLTYIFSK